MTKTSLIRKFEWMLVITASVGYIIKSLLYDALDFDIKVRAAIGSGVSVPTILKALSHYDHTLNHNLPVIAAGVLCLAAWYLFHYLLFPKIRKEPFGVFEFTLLTIIGGLLASGAFILLNTIEIAFRQDARANIVGLKDVTHFRKLFVISDSIAFFTLICIYEVMAQGYYKLYERLEEEPHGKILNYFLMLLLGSFAFAAMVSTRLVPFLLHANDSRVVLAIALVLLFLYILQEYYFRHIHIALPGDSMLTRFRAQISTYLFLVFIASMLFLGIRARISTRMSPSLIWVPVSLLIFPAAIAIGRRKRQVESSKLKAQVSVKSAELAQLRSQINPHFLFNALNSLYATALKENSSQTAEGIQKLGDIMRFMLDENNRDRIPLQQEIAYLHNYIDIQNMRLDRSQQIEVKVHLQDTEQEIYIAPMLLNPFVENAFKHGISFRYPSWIYITLTLDREKLFFKVHNSLHKFQGLNTEKSVGGIGLDNVRQRLELVYPGRYALEVQESERDFFISLTLTY